GIDETAPSNSQASVQFEVLGDGNRLYISPTMRATDDAISLDIDLSGVQVLTLRVHELPDQSPASDPDSHDHSDWAGAVLTKTGASTAEDNAFKIFFTIEGSGQFSSASPLTASVNATSSCGQVLSSLNLGYASDFKLTNTSIENLTTDVGNSWGASWADFNGDGYEDLFVPEFNHWSGNKLYINDGSGGFTPSASAGAPIQDRGAAAGSSWGDYDNDGDMDLFVSNNVRAVNHLYQNNGDGTFTRKDSSEIGELADYAGYCHNAAWIDYDNDGYLDLFVSDFMPTRYNQMYHNEGDGTFTRATDNPIALEAKFSMGGTWADYDGDGLLDLFIPNGRDDNNSLYHNEGNGQFSKIASGNIVNDGGNSTGSSWGDYDNDGDMDLYVTNASNQKNFFYINNGNGTFTRDYDQIIVQEHGHSHGSAWADLDKDGDLDLIVGNDNGNVNYIYKNNGDGSFSKSDVVKDDAENTMGMSLADYDLDGDLDLFMANNRQSTNTFYRNDIDPCISYKGIQLVGERSNKSAVGARLRLKANIYGEDVWQTRQINTQSGGGASGQSSIRAYFGLGDATIIDSLVIDWPSGFEQTLTNVSINDIQTIIEEDGAEICGTVFYDMNNNCVQDPNEPGVPNILLEVYPGPKYVTTNDQGEYQIYRQYGTYTISSISTAEWSNIANCDSSHTIVYNSAKKQSSLSFCGKDFAMEPSCSKPDLVTYLSSTALRRGFQNSYAISYLNRGALAANDLQLVVEFDNDIMPLSSDLAWDAVTPGPTVTEYVWNIGTLNPMEQATIMITDSVSAVAEMGKMAEVRAYFRNPPDDCDLSNNLTIDYNEVVGAVDPNDILVFPKGSVLDTDTLTYKIRFQNVGNKFAQNVIIRDTLSPHLNLSTIEVETASHSYRYEISEDRVLSFFFDRIFLPDSTSNEAASHGFVQFKIKPGEGVLVGTIIENTAAIQFDFNEYIITNTVKNQVVNALSLAEQSQLELKVNPNPLVDESFAELYHKTEAGIRINIERLEIYNTLGNLVHVLSKVDQPMVAIRKNHLPAGVFIVKAYDKNGFSYSQKIEVR
ncbi:MAG: FG-GAP-like repeat-containing protein, partial [Bacteroidota bacterium]